MTRYLAAALLVAALLASPPAALAAPCAGQASVAGWLRDAHAERLAAYGLGANGDLIELYRAPGGGFTVVATSPQGVSCILLHGQGWGPAPPAGDPPASRSPTEGEP